MSVYVVRYRTIADKKGDASSIRTMVFREQDAAHTWMRDILIVLIEYYANSTWKRIENRHQEEYFVTKFDDRIIVLRDEVRDDLRKLTKLAEAWRHGEFVPWRWELEMVEAQIM